MGSTYARRLVQRGEQLVECGARPNQNLCDPNGRQVRPGTGYARALQLRGVNLVPCGQARTATGLLCQPNGRPVRPGPYARSLQARGVVLSPCGQTGRPTLPRVTGGNMCDPQGRQVRPGTSYAARLQQRGVTLVPCGQTGRPTLPRVTGGNMCDPQGRQVRPGTSYAARLQQRGVTLVPCAAHPTLPAVGRPAVLPATGVQSMCDPRGRPVRPGTSYAARLQQRGVTLVPCAGASRTVLPTLPAVGRPAVLPATGNQNMCDPQGRLVRPGTSYAARLQQQGVTLVPCTGAAAIFRARAVADSSSTFENTNTQTTPAWGVALVVIAVVMIVVLAIVVVKLVMYLRRD